ncbi:hypothetical protein AK812_SmicGene17093 [Symbiodinium microadriaticum]|uniref:DNA (cytosine-5-)-methyltransferase n=1 Tax=Symbiodinium microadriaticum TaxID=2951 RepID=A0A1Q9DYI2_SYMMI|nr:hypothetical protein AK812_SmicGene17093 [Symbiodinium microadriaticum]
MAHSGASSADAAAWADFASAAGLDVTISTPSPTTTAPGVEAALAAPPASGEPEAEEPPSSGGMLEGILAEPPALGEPALVETAPVDDDIAPPVLGVPSSSEDEEELIADPAGAPMVGAPPAAGGTADVGVQTSQNVIIPAFDMVDVAAQTDGKVDRACNWVEHRGDFTRDSPQDVADLVLDSDPNAEAMVVWCAAPPCQDFSRIAQGAGHQGDRGRLFEESVAFMDELRAALKSHRFAFLYENVEMSGEAAKVSSDALGVQPVFVCPSDFGWVSRPRLWWLSVDWTRLASDPADGSPLEWAKKGRWDRLRLAAVRASADSFDLGGLSSTRPWPREDARWLEGGRQFAPWHSVEAMLQDAKGVLHIPPPEVKEQLHHIPPGFTGQIDDALANDSLFFDEASRLAGRLTFLSQSTFGATGRAAIKPLYSRAADTAANSDATLVPWPGRVTGPFPVLYADAFFLDGDLRKKPGHLAAGEAVPKAARWQNGWGYVLLLDGHVFYDYGVIRPEHLAPFAARKAFIYVLEIVAQVLPLVTFARRLSPFWIAFIDNVAGQFALMKGYGKDPSVNGILASFWGLASDRQWAPDFHRVPSASNVSDAISRGDDSRARAEGWTRVATPVDDIMDVLGRAASDIDFACHSALGEGAEVRTPAPAPSFWGGVSSIIAAFLAAKPSGFSDAEAALYAFIYFGICSEAASQTSKGPGSLRLNLLDQLYNFDLEQLGDDD